MPDRASFLKMNTVQAADVKTGYNIMLTIKVLFSCLLLEQEYTFLSQPLNSSNDAFFRRQSYSRGKNKRFHPCLAWSKGW